MHGSQAASPVVSGDYDGAGCCVLVRVRLRAHWRRRPVVESQKAIDAVKKNSGHAVRPPVLKEDTLSLAHKDLVLKVKSKT